MSLALCIEPEIEPQVANFGRAGELEIWRYRPQNRPKRWRLSIYRSGPKDIGPGPIALEEIGPPFLAI
jgi:hypothetical protein